MSDAHAGGAHSRIDLLAEFVPAGSRVADVGTDRAILPRRLLATGRASRCIATERDPERLARARLACERSARRDELDLRAGDGLAALSAADRVDVVIVAGLGGPAIARIVARGRPADLGIARLVLQPRTDPAAVRRALAGSGYRIVDERLGVERGRWFVVIVADAGPAADGRDGPATLSDDDLLEAGPCLVRSGDPAVAAHWRAERERNEAILREARGGRGRGRAQAERRRDLALRVLAALGAFEGRREA